MSLGKIRDSLTSEINPNLVNNNEKTKTEYEPIIEMFYYLQLNLNENKLVKYQIL